MVDSVLDDILLLLAATLAVVVALRRLRLPPIIGFLLAGMAIGPHALGWVAATETTTTLAEFGIVGRDPDPDMTLREGDVVVLFGMPEAQEHAESVLLAG